MHMLLLFFPTGQSCGNTFTSPTGTLTSENYPSNYPSLSDCSNIISVPDATSILIQFNAFEVEDGFDYLYYGLGDTPDVNNALDRLSGITLPQAFALQSGTVWFLFMSDRSVQGFGYSLNWTAVVDPGSGGIVFWFRVACVFISVILHSRTPHSWTHFATLCLVVIDLVHKGVKIIFFYFSLILLALQLMKYFFSLKCSVRNIRLLASFTILQHIYVNCNLLGCYNVLL